MKLITLKIGRHQYDITHEDEFMDNGSIVTLTTQSKEGTSFGFRPDPRLPKRAVKELAAFNRHEVRKSGPASYFVLLPKPETLTQEQVDEVFSEIKVEWDKRVEASGKSQALFLASDSTGYVAKFMANYFAASENVKSLGLVMPELLKATEEPGE